MDVVTYDAEAIAAGWARLEQRPTHRHYRPLIEAVDSFEREAKATERLYLGIDEIDREMRGISAGHLAMIVGYSHSGKTLVLLNALRQNRTKRIALYIPDEPATLVLTKLACLSSGVPAREIEQRVADDDIEALELLRRVATEEFPNLAVFDKPLSPGDMERSFEELCDVWGAPPELVVFDYLELLQAGETVQQKADWIKAFGSRHEVPMIVVHQTSRTAGAEGRKMTISSGAYGGEQHATFLIGVRRKKAGLLAELAEQQEKFERTGSDAAHERIQAIRHDLAVHEYSLTVNLVKNKRPGGSLVDDLDFELEIDTGRIWPLRNGDLPKQYLEKRPTPAEPQPVTSWEQPAWDDNW